MSNISVYFLPLIVLIIIIYGFYKKSNIYDDFTDGAKEGLITVFKIFPFLIGMILAINLFLSSGLMDYLINNFFSFLKYFSFPVSVYPLALLRPISGSASLAVLNDILKNQGPDSFAGRLASTIQGCTDTTLYILTLYFGSVKITKCRYALKVGLLADLIGIIASFLVVSWLF